MTSARILSLAILWLLAPCAVLPAAQPNVLFIAVDDMRCELGCCYAAHVKSPHMERLAASGVLFNRAYCQQAVCNPSRVSLMTGLRPDTTRGWDLVTEMRTVMPDVVTWLHAALTQLDQPESHAISTERWRYIHYQGGDEELYDIATDPHEWTNLAAKPEHATKLAELRARAPKEMVPLALPKNPMR